MPGIGQRQLGGDGDKLRALIVTGHTDIHHDWRTMSPMLAQLLRDTGLFDVRITEEFRGAGPETLEPYDLVVLNYFGRFEPWGRAPEQRWGPRAEQALYDFVAGGGGVVVYHASLQMGAGWEDDFERMAGGVLRAALQPPRADPRLPAARRRRPPDHRRHARVRAALRRRPLREPAVGARGRRRGAGARLGQPAALHAGARSVGRAARDGGGAPAGLDEPLRRGPGVRDRDRARPGGRLAPLVPGPVHPRRRVGGHGQGHRRAARGIRRARSRRRLVAHDLGTDGPRHVRADGSREQQ